MEEDTDLTIEEISYEVECFMDENINAKHKRFPIKRPLTVNDIMKGKYGRI